MDAFADGFSAGYHRGWKAARADLHRHLRGIADPGTVTSAAYADVGEALTEELLSREAARHPARAEQTPDYGDRQA